ncbi:lipoprotein-releasing ABC transporter permease subunit [Pseudocolwellia sp. HL-MZ19]|uniref:lipoprotein-releasing ABC transporter permease subunit n=1 Tax=unclassified Pseudocolwellia TaxID=2848178 RepID=UPI003CF60BF5
MFKPLSLFLALRYVRSRQGNGFASFISASSTVGIALGVMVLIVVLSAMNGFEKALADKFLSVIPHGQLIGVNAPIPQWNTKAAQVLKSEHIIAAAPMINVSGMMQYKGQVKGIELKGVDLKLEQQVSSIADYIVEGKWNDLSEPNGILIGAGIAKKLALSLGDSVQLLLPQHVSLQGNHNVNQSFPIPLTQQVTIVGIFKFGGVVDDMNAYMQFDNVSTLMGYNPGQAQGLSIKVDNVFNAPKIIREAAYKLDHYVYVSDWTNEQGHLFNDIQLVRMVMYIVLIIVIAVASFNIVSTLIMAVNEKKGDIAILKTMGASSFVIMCSFMIQGLVNGIVGVTAGAFSGIYLANNLTDIIREIEMFFGIHFLSSDIYFIDFLPSYLHYPDVYVTVITALFLSLVATLYPAWSATKIDPAQVLGQL